LPEGEAAHALCPEVDLLSPDDASCAYATEASTATASTTRFTMRLTILAFSALQNFPFVKPVAEVEIRRPLFAQTEFAKVDTAARQARE
jgi:hypothetical protein